MKPLLTASVIALSGMAFKASAHPGHGAGSIHGHPGDLTGLVVVLGLALLALWLSRR